MCSPKSSPYWKSNSSWPDFSTGIASLRPCSLASFGMSRAELLVDEHAGRVGVDAALDGDLHALVDQLLGVGDRRRSPPASGRPRSRTSSSGTSRGGRRPGCRAFRRSRGPWSVHLCRSLVERRHRLPSRAVEPNFTGPSYTLGIEEELMILDARDARARERDRVAARGRRRRDGEIKPELHGVRARDRHEAVRRTRARRAPAARPAPPGRARSPARRDLRDRLGRHAPVRAVGGPADRRAARATAT